MTNEESPDSDRFLNKTCNESDHLSAEGSPLLGRDSPPEFGNAFKKDANKNTEPNIEEMRSESGKYGSKTFKKTSKKAVEINIRDEQGNEKNYSAKKIETKGYKRALKENVKKQTPEKKKEVEAMEISQFDENISQRRNTLTVAGTENTLTVSYKSPSKASPSKSPTKDQALVNSSRSIKVPSDRSITKGYVKKGGFPNISTIIMKKLAKM